MQALTASDRSAGFDGLTLSHKPYPHLAENDVVVRVHAAGFTPGELDWPGTWVDRAGRDRSPSVPGHDLSGVVAELGYGTTGLSIGQRVFGLGDWTRDGTLAEYIAVEARNLAPLPADIDFITAAALPVSGLTAYQSLFVHAQLAAGQTLLINGVTGGVGWTAAQLARQVGARTIGIGRPAHREAALELGLDAYHDAADDRLENVGHVDIVLDTIGGQIRERTTRLLRPGGTLVTIADPPQTQPEHGQARFFVVEPNRTQLKELAQQVRDRHLQPAIARVVPLTEARHAFTTKGPTIGKTIVQVTEG